MVKGDVYNEWTVLDPDARMPLSEARKRSGSLKGPISPLCQCVCGNKRQVYKSDLIHGRSKNCGCKRHNDASLRAKARNTTHGMKGTGAYSSWLAMKGRCKHPATHSYSRYGGRGVTVCERWISSFENFFEDMGARPEGMSLDRIDPNGNYEPTNCRWSTASEQRMNQDRASTKNRN